MISIREISGDEWETYRAVRLSALADSPDAFGGTLADSLALTERQFRDRIDGPGTILIAFRYDAPVAMGGVFPQPEQGRADVWGMWTAPEVRRQGLADRILVRLLEWSREHDLQPHLHVTRGNGAARTTYLKHGFAPTGVVEPLRPGSELEIEELALLARH